MLVLPDSCDKNEKNKKKKKSKFKNQSLTWIMWQINTVFSLGNLIWVFTQITVLGIFQNLTPNLLCAWKEDVKPKIYWWKGVSN